MSEDAKDELEAIFDRRPADEATLWPRDLDQHLGNPVDICETCGHQRQVHGEPDGEDLGTGVCHAMVGGTDLFPMQEVGQSMFPREMFDAMQIRIGADSCSCQCFKGPPKISRLHNELLK